ncbi:hypothetical protein M8J76_002293 [Diaphorina citri]|nr:hypothetical protein M8J75_003249 [Diaphorina citri]KAI5736348.1 hypothetical protein M8J76_002293 [Diaphorina citri]
MSKNTVHFTISNPAISFLLHDCVKSPHNQTGFLFGEIHRKVSNVTTDSHSNNETVEITVSITATLPFSESEDLLFSKDGTLNEDVVGWYSFTRNQDLSQSLCQLFLAHHFSNYFSHIPKQLFLFFRISTNVVFEENFTYTNKFLCTTGSDISTPVELHIRQLGESTHEYNAHKPVTKHSQIFDTVLNTLEWNSKDIVSSYENLQSLLCDKLLEQIDHVPTKNSNPMTNDIEDNHMQVSPEPELAEDDPMDASGGDAPSPQPQGNPSTLTPPHQTNSKPNKSKPEGRIVPSNKLQLHAPTTTGRGSSRPGTFGVMRPGGC